MNDWGRFNDQFRETEYERQERWRVTRQQRRERGECWQCGKKISACTCPNVSHEQDDDAWVGLRREGHDD